MGSSIITVLICTLVTCAGLIHGQGMQRIAGHVLYRHGDRTPVTTFPLDPVKPDEWPNGYGQLTAAGIEQQHRLGAHLRTRYETLLSSTYHPSEFVIRSTDVDRTLMSAQSHLVGLYPAMNATSDKVPIQPIPIHTVSIGLDFLLGQNDCPRYDQLEEEVNESDEVKRMNAYYQPFFQQLQTWTGLVNITVYNAWDVADTVFVEHIYNRTPAWANEGVRQNLSDVNDLAFHYLFANNDTQRIRGGPLIQDIWMNMNNSVHGRSFHKVKMYSAHDTTVSAVLAFLGINYPHQPQYASALFVDLYQNGTSYFVQVDYLNVTDSNKPYPYVLDGCPASACPLETFADIYQPRFPGTADKECAKKEPPMPPMGGDSSTLIVVLVVSIVGLVSVIFVIFLCISLRKTDRDPPLIPFERSLQAL